MRLLHQRYTLYALNSSLLFFCSPSLSHSYLDGVDTYIFVPQGTAQSLTVHRATGDVLINRVSCLVLLLVVH